MTLLAPERRLDPKSAELETCRKWMLPMLMGGAMQLSYHDAEDVIHDAIVARLETDGILNLRAWLAGTAFLTAVALLRKRLRRAEHKQPIARHLEQLRGDPASETKQRELAECIGAAVAALPGRLRFLWLREQNAETVQDLAALMGVKPRRIYQLLAEANQRLREYLEPIL